VTKFIAATACWKRLTFGVYGIEEGWLSVVLVFEINGRDGPNAQKCQALHSQRTRLLINRCVGIMLNDLII